MWNGVQLAVELFAAERGKNAYLGGGQIELVQDEPVSSSHGLSQDTLAEGEGAVGGVGAVRAHVLLNVRVLVVVDADQAVAAGVCQELDQAGLTS